jgi:hypothetical protein
MLHTREACVGPVHLIAIEVLSSFVRHWLDPDLSLVVSLLISLTTRLMFPSEPLVCFGSNPLHTLVSYPGGDYCSY